MKAIYYFFMGLFHALGIDSLVLQYLIYIVGVVIMAYCAYFIIKRIKSRTPQNELAWFVEAIERLYPEDNLEDVYNTEKDVLKVFYNDITTILYYIKRHQLVISVEYKDTTEFPQTTRKELQAKVDDLTNNNPSFLYCDAKIYLYPLSVKAFIDKEKVNPEHLPKIIKDLEGFLAGEAYYLIRDEIQLPTDFNTTQYEKGIAKMSREVKGVVDKAIVRAFIKDTTILMVFVYINATCDDEAIRDNLAIVLHRNLEAIRQELQNVVLANEKGIYINQN